MARRRWNWAKRYHTPHLQPNEMNRAYGCSPNFISHWLCECETNSSLLTQWKGKKEYEAYEYFHRSSRGGRWVKVSAAFPKAQILSRASGSSKRWGWGHSLAIAEAKWLGVEWSGARNMGNVNDNAGWRPQLSSPPESLDRWRLSTGPVT